MAKNPLKSRIEHLEGSRIMIAPLNWGLGHATRCVPIIKALIEAGKEVVIAADGYPLIFLKKEFPEQQTIDFKWTTIHYGKSNSQIMTMVAQLPKFIYNIVKEHFILKRLVKEHGIETVISDNRFGLWHNKIHCIYITHQVSVKIGRYSFMNKMAYLLHKWIIERYDECWIPDFEGDSNLSGDLSHKYPTPNNSHFIGILSRFM